ncbi:MAG: NTP transferase domain-containing protein [Thermoanaerobacteraceae bacterium]|nr:NTP transferase domain-containing protein [Thermoanaerobacteraceae bacterium]
MKAIIMAGGEGSRLRPLTCRRPKPLVPVANRPVMEYCVDLLRRQGFAEIGVTLQYLPGLIQEYFGDGSDFGVHLQYFVETTPLGTAGSVRNAAPFLDQTFVVVSGDALTDFDLREAVAFHRERGALATLVLTQVENPLEYGVVITDPDGKIRAFLEKPSWGEVFSDRVNTGIYILEPEVLDLIPPDRPFDFSKDLFPLLLKEDKPLYGITLEGYWCDIGNIAQYWQAHQDILSGKARVRIVGEDRGNGLVTGEGVEIHPMAEIRGPVLIGGFCRIGPGARVGPYTVLGPYCRLGEGARAERAILWDGVTLRAGSRVEGGILLSRVSVEEGARVLEGAVVGDASRILARAEIRPQVKVWPEKCVGQDAVLQETLVWGQGTGRPLFIGSAVPGFLRGDFNPSQAARLAAAFGATFKPGASVGVSACGGPAGDMLAKAVAAGLMSTGVKVVEMGRLLMPVFRFGVRALELDGACHLKEDTEVRGKVWLYLVNGRGADLPPADVRKVENLFWREDVRQVEGDEIVEVAYRPGLVEAYLDYLLGTLDTDKITRRRPRVALGCQEGSAEIAGRLLSRAGCEVIRLDFAPRRTWGEIQRELPFFAREIGRYGADLGAVIDKNAERLLLLDAGGFLVDEARWTALLTRIYLEETESKTLALPMVAPRAAEIVAADLGGRIRRVKNHPGLVHQAVLEEDGPGRYSQFNLQFDALAALAYLIDWLARHDLSLAEAVDGLPAVYRSTRLVPCPWQAKGRVMRSLVGEEDGRRVELLDGIQVSYPQGWALVLPDQEEPLYRVYSEAFSQEAAEELAAFYEKRLQEIIRRGESPGL